MNAVHLVGTVVRDPMVREKEGKIVSDVVLAIPWSLKDSDGTDYVRCVGFKRSAELIRDYVAKGSRVGISGKVVSGKYTTNEGETKYTTDILIHSIEFLGHKGKNPKFSKAKREDNDNSSPSSVNPTKDVVQNDTPDGFGFDANDDDIPDIELPF